MRSNKERTANFIFLAYTNQGFNTLPPSPTCFLIMSAKASMVLSGSLVKSSSTIRV